MLYKPSLASHLFILEIELASAERPLGTTWSVFGREVPKGEIVFFSQVILIYMVICISLYNLSTGRDDSNLWISLLSGCLGYVLPSPSLK
jgi:hypothetical protein